MTTHLMLDLETFGLGERAAIIQVGVCAFDPEAVRGTPGIHVSVDPAYDGEGELAAGASQEWNVNLASSLFYGGEMEAETFAWWRDKDRDHQQSVTQCGYTIPFILDSLDAFCTTYNPTRIWSHGATFDIPIISSYYRALKRLPPWNYTNARDTRTLFQLAKDIVVWNRPDRGPTAHTAKADAIAQAKDVQLAIAALKNGCAPTAQLDDLK